MGTSRPSAATSAFQGQQIERGRAVEHDERIAAADGRDGLAQAEFAA